MNTITKYSAILTCCEMEAFQDISENNSLLHSPVYHYIIRASVGTASCLSIIGASLIIVTYVAFPELRTTLRQILVNLSIADLICATGFLVGIAINFYRHLDPRLIPYQNQSEAFQYACVIQGGFAVLGSDASILWTMSMAVYMFVVVVLRRPKNAEKLLPLHYLISWGVPIVITVVFGAVGWLGFEPQTTAGWCDITTHPNPSGSNSSTEYTVLPVVIRYTLFLYASFLLLPPLFLAIRCSLLNMFRRNRRLFAGSEDDVKLADLKLVFIPLIFIMLRVWSVIVNPFIYFVDDDTRENFRMSPVSAVLVLLRGLGFSLQGFFNAVLFIGFTKQVRARLERLLRRNICCLCLRVCRDAKLAEPYHHFAEGPINQASSAMSDFHETTPLVQSIRPPTAQETLHQSLLESINT